MFYACAFVLCASAYLLTEVHSLQWQQELKDGAELTQCVGQNVTFPWRYVLETDDDFVGISWNVRLQNEEKEMTLGTFMFDQFSPSKDRVYQVDTAGIKLADIRVNDSGAYIVNVRLNGRDDLPSQTAHLVVAEPPETSKGRLEVKVSNVQSGETTESLLSANGKDHLLCGQFSYLGSPPVSVVWETPDGEVVPSTGYEQGYFFLDISQRSKGGDYYCLLNLSSTAVGCLPADSALRDKSVIAVLERTSPATAASISDGAIASIVIAVIIVIAAAVIISVFLFLRHRRGKSYAPKEPDSPLPEDAEAAEPLKV